MRRVVAARSCPIATRKLYDWPETPVGFGVLDSAGDAEGTGAASREDTTPDPRRALEYTCRAAELSSLRYDAVCRGELDDLARRHVAATISALTRRLRAFRLRFIAAKSIFSRAAKCSSQRDLLGLIRCLLSIVINKL